MIHACARVERGRYFNLLDNQWMIRYTGNREKYETAAGQVRTLNDSLFIPAE